MIRDLSRSISIHSPHVRRDLSTKEDRTVGLAISIHSPHVRRDKQNPVTVKDIDDFNPLSSCEERQTSSHRLVGGHNISIHSPHVRRDGDTYKTEMTTLKFQSTLLM